MMGRIANILILTLMGSSLLGQQKFEFKIDALTQYNRIDKQERLELMPGLTIKNGLHNLRLAPVIQWYTTEARNEPEQLRLTGLSGMYIMDCKTQFKSLSFFFNYETKLQWFEERWTGNYFDQDLNIYRDYSYKSEEFFNTHTLGYGFRFKFLKHFYLQHSIAGGIRISRIEGEPNSANAPSDEAFDFRGYDNFGFHWSGSLSLGYQF